MNLIIIHKDGPPVADANGSGDNLLRFALASEPIAGVILDGLSMLTPAFAGAGLPLQQQRLGSQQKGCLRYPGRMEH